MKYFLGLLALAWVLPAASSVVGGSITDEADDEVDGQGHHHHHHRHHRHKRAVNATQKSAGVVATQPQQVVKAAVQGSSIVDKMKKLEAELAEKNRVQAATISEGSILVNGPLPADFHERFAQAVYQDTGSDPKTVTVTSTKPLEDNKDVVEISFKAPHSVVKKVENDAADPSSKLAQGNMHSFLVAKSKDDSAEAEAYHEEKEDDKRAAEAAAAGPPPAPIHLHHEEEAVAPVESRGIDIDTAMPYGDLEPFGREDTAQELTESSVKESDAMVDQLERAEVAEEKRAVFRALTRLRGAAITSFDGVARSQTGNIDEYNKVHKWRNTHPLHHLADEESDVSKWAFPDNADFIQLKHK